MPFPVCMGEMKILSPKILCVGALILYEFSGCMRSKEPEHEMVQQEPITKIAPPTPIQKQKEKLGGSTWDHEWDQLIERSLPRAMLSTRVPRDVSHFCPRFYQMSDLDKRTFWAYFFQALAGAEAGLDPSTSVRHNEPEVAKIDSVSHQWIRSEGLLQLAYEDHRRYGCNFDWKSDKRLGVNDPRKTILDPENNLKCGIKILTKQIIVHHKPLLSPSGYWSTLHPGTFDFLVFSRQMTNPPSACGRSVKHAKSLARNRQGTPAELSAASERASK